MPTCDARALDLHACMRWAPSSKLLAANRAQESVHAEWGPPDSLLLLLSHTHERLHRGRFLLLRACLVCG
jgi:hypothetical protein